MLSLANAFSDEDLINFEKKILNFLSKKNDFKIFFLDYKKHSVIEADRMELLTSKENLEENINILCIKKNP